MYTVTKEGDGAVPLAFARLEGIPEAQTYYVEESHGSLPNNDLVEQAVRDLLEHDTTSVLPNVLPAIRRETAAVRESEIWTQGIGLEGMVSVPPATRDVLRAVAASEPVCAPQPVAGRAMAAAGTATAGAGPALHFERLFVAHHRRPQMEVRCGRCSITQVDSRAYVLGLFKNVVPSGAANAIDQRLRGAIGEFTARRMFTGEVGEIFTLPVGRGSLRADMVLFAGLGSFDQFDSDVQEMVAENIMRVLVRTRVEEFATVLMGAATTRDRIAELLESLLKGFIRGLKEADRDGVSAALRCASPIPSAWRKSRMSCTASPALPCSRKSTSRWTNSNSSRRNP